MARVYIIQDPYHPYAQRIVETLWTRYGLKAVCVFTDPEERGWLEAAHPLPQDAVLEHHARDPLALEAFAREVADRHELVAVLPWLEKVHSDAVRMMRAAGLNDWNDLDRVALFRDKDGLKSFLRERAPELRMNATRLVKTAAEVIADPPSKRIVLKPNDGYAQVGVAILDADDHASIRAFFANDPGETLLEEYIGGVEMAVNGQCDHAGSPEVWSVITYINDVVPSPLHDGGRTVHASEPAFDLVVDYAERVMRATGLKRCPFHLEVKVDDEGPCMIECAARPLGMRAALRYDALHGPRFSALDWAAHHWVSDAPYLEDGRDWTRYEAIHQRDVFGTSSVSGRLYSVEGADAIEGLPGFLRWLKLPVAGERLNVHESLFSLAWGVQLQGDNPEALQRQADRARELMKLNTDGPKALKARVLGRKVLDRVVVEARRRLPS